jgi:hypothetical protein
MTLVLMLSAMGAGAQTYTLTLKAGAGTGSDVTISNADAANVATSQSAAHNGQFWQEGDQWWFKYPDCPSTFSSPDEEKILVGWDGASVKPGTVWPITADMTLTAYWDMEEFDVTGEDDEWHAYILLCRVTSRSLSEVEIKECGSIENGCAIVIPETVEHNGVLYSVTSIRHEAFTPIDAQFSVSIPASVRSIGKKAFLNCDRLESVTFAEGSQLTSIGDDAFDGCNNLATVTFAEGSQLTSIGGGAFNACNNLTSIDLPASVTSIGGGAFYACNNLATVTLHSNPTIRFSAFPDGATVTMTLPTNPANGAYWTTFYSYFYHFQADENTKVYKATVSGTELTLHEVGDKIVEDETAVILKSSVDHLVMTLTTSSSADTDDNDLKGTYERKLCSDILIDNFLPSSGCTIYVMGKPEGKEMGFYEYTGEYMPANKAYIALAPSAGAPTRGLSFVEEEVTNIESVDSGQLTVDNWYTLSGVKLTGKPTTKGVYLYNGHKYVVQ